MYSDRAIMEVKPDEAGGECVILGNPILDLFVHNGLEVGAGSRVMV